jgi:hypothetical protein
MYQYRCVHRNTDTDSTDTGPTDDTETLKSVPQTTPKHRKSVFHRQCWCIHRHRHVTNQMGMSKCIISDTDLSVFSVISDAAISVIGDTDLSISVLSVTLMSVSSVFSIPTLIHPYDDNVLHRSFII